MNIVNQEDIEQLFGIDALFGTIDDMYGHPPNWSRPQGFISLSKIILEQQLSLASANAHFNKLDSYLEEFTPSNILILSDEEMRRCHISWQKAKYLRALSAAILNGDLDLDELPKLSEPEIRINLTKITGIGDWTADIYLMFCLQSKNIFPAGDIAVVNTVKELTDSKTKSEIMIRADKWRPYRSLATYFLWHYYLSKKSRAYNKQANPQLKN
jgi:DNA-3-methyladenine glycosylase II